MTTPITITKRLEFDYGHRLLRHEGKCASIHGHRGVVLLTVRQKSGELDSIGRVIDFSVIKSLMGGWLDENWDHAFLFEQGDPVGAAVQLDGKRHFVLPFPPTAENLASMLVLVAVELLGPLGIEVVSVEFFETPTSSAVAVAEAGR